MRFRPAWLIWIGLCVMLVPGAASVIVYLLARLTASAGADATPISSGIGFLTVFAAIGTLGLLLTVLPIGAGLCIWGFVQVHRAGHWKRWRGSLIVFVLLIVAYSVEAWWILRS